MLPLLATARTVLQNYIDLPRMVYVLCFGSLINRAGSFVMLFCFCNLLTSIVFMQGFATLPL